jgi:hypothetical protein
MPECPKNGLIMFDEFAGDDKAKLEVILKDSRYADIRKTETSYYRAMWLAREIGRSGEMQRSLLRQAIWQTDDKPEQRKRYFAEYVALAPKRPDGALVVDQAWLEVTIANAERELGLFDAAKKRLDAIDVASVKKDGEDNTSLDDEQSSLTDYKAKMLRAIARGDAAIEPMDMLDDGQAASICREKKTLSGFEIEYCKRSEVQAILKSWK